MKRCLVLISSLFLAAGCLPTSENTPFGGSDNNPTTDGGNNNNIDDGGNNVSTDGGNNTTDDAGNNTTDDAGNNTTEDMGNNTTEDMGGGTDMCVPEDDTTFCTRQGAQCESFTSADNCGMQRTVDCGTCPNNEACANNVCEGCVAETDPEFCTRLNAECGQVTALDNCRDSRTVNCGGCAGNGVGCNLDNLCVETQCRDTIDNDGENGADCDDPACLGQQCSNAPNKVCQADGTCN